MDASEVRVSASLALATLGSSHTLAAGVGGAASTSISATPGDGNSAKGASTADTCGQVCCSWLCPCVCVFDALCTVLVLLCK